jgi:hypothetical protein
MLAATLLMLLATFSRDIRYACGECDFIAINNASLRFGYEAWLGIEPVPGFSIRPSEHHPEWAHAWRPFHVSTGGHGYSIDYKVFPLWHPLLASLIALGASFAPTAWACLARWRLAKGLCPRCRYDLRGLPRTHGERTCPECGEKRPAPMA